MKKIINILALLLCTFVVSCGDEDTYDDTSALKVISSEVTFEASGGNGAIQVAATGSIAATSNREWCQVTVADNTVNVVVAENDDMSNRTAAVTITSGEAKTLVAVTQGGVVTLYKKSELGHVFTYAGGTATVSFSSTANYQIEIPEDARGWLTYAVDKENQTLTFTVAASTEKTPRGAAVKVVAGKKTIVYNIGSYEMKDIAGNWIVSFTDVDGQPLAGAITVTPVKDSPTLFSINGISQYFNGIAVFEDNALRIKGGVKLGMFADVYFVYTAILSQGGYLSYSPNADYVAYPSSKDGKFRLVFGDNGWFGDDVSNGFSYQAFETEPPSSAGNAGYLEMFFDFVLSK